MLTERAHRQMKRVACDAGVSIATLHQGPAATQPELPSVTTATNRRPTEGFTRASGIAFAIYVGGAGLTSVAQFVIARLVGVASYGAYSYVFAWMTVLAYCGTLGFNVALLRFVSAYSATDRWGLARGVIQFALTFSLIASVALATLVAAIMLSKVDQVQSELVACMLLGLLSVPFMTAYLVGGAILRAFGGVISALLPERIVRDGLLLVFIAFAAVATDWPLDATLITISLLGSSVITVIAVVVIAIKLCPYRIWHVRPIYAVGDWLVPVLPIMIMVGLDILISRTGVMMLGWAGRTTEAGIFALGFNMAMLLALPGVAVSTIFAPTVASFHARGNITQLQKTFSVACVTSLVGAGLLAAPLMTQMDVLLSWFDPRFADAAPVAQILVLGQVIAAAAGPQQNILIMTGHERTSAILMLGYAVLNMISCAIGIALYGAIGAAVAITTTLVLWNIAMACCIRKILRLTPGLVHAIKRKRSVV